MYSFINYLIENSLGLAVLILGYKLLFNREKHFQFKRLFLLTGTIIVLFLPLLHLESKPKQITVSSNFSTPVILPEIQVNSQPDTITAESIDGWQILFYIYVSGLAVMALLFLYRLMRLVVLIYRNHSYSYKDKYTIVEIQAASPAFSFFNYIFLNQKFVVSFSESERAQIIRHEMAHADNFHSADILFAELIKVIFWFNPAVYFLKKELAAIHEFEADARVLHDENPDSSVACWPK